MSQLDRDISKMGKGADTVIGERGINISGGQKARISLARAVFSNADIYLLDDPLSAVDPEVANAIYKECIKGAAAEGKCVVLVTHQLQFISDCTKILILAENGAQLMQGNYQEVQSADFDIEAILNSYSNQMEANSDNQDLKKRNFQAEEKKAIQNSAKRAKENDEPMKESLKQQDLIQDEEMEKGSVSLRDVRDFLKFSCKDAGIFLYLFVSMVPAVASLVFTLWMGYWAEQDLEEQ